MANPVLTPELLDRYAEVVEAYAARDGDRLSEALANVWGIVGTAKILLAVVAERDEARAQVARLTRERDGARLQGAREERAAVVAWLRTDEPYRTWGESIGGTELSCVIDAIDRGEHIPKRSRPTEPIVIYDWGKHPEPEGWGDFIDLAPLSGDLSTLSDEAVALRLAVLLSQISEEVWCAGWMQNLGAWSLRWADGVDLPGGLDPDLPDVLHRARTRLNGRWVDCEPGVGVVLREVGDE